MYYTGGKRFAQVLVLSQSKSYCLETLEPLGGRVGAEFWFGRFTCCSILVSSAADVLFELSLRVDMHITCLTMKSFVLQSS